MLLLALAVCMVAILAVGGTLAYFTDTDTAKNVFTVGKIKIALNEYNANGDDDNPKGEQDEDYRDWLKENEDSLLMPGTEIPKYVVVKNTGTRDAYCWIEVWVPTILNDTNSLHICNDDAELEEIYGKGCMKCEAFGATKMIDGVEYSGYKLWIFNFATEESVTLTAPACETPQIMHGIKMDEKVRQVIDDNGNVSWILADGKTPYAGSWDVIVNAIGFQADNVSDIYAAMGSYYNGSSMTIPD